MPYTFNPFLGTLDATGGGGNTYNITNNLFIDQTGATGATYGSLAGSVNGTNKVFTVSHGSYNTSALAVYLNGQLLSQGTDADWVETTPSSGTLTFADAPLAGDRIIAVYMA